MIDAIEEGKKFRIDREPDPATLTAIRAREQVCDDPKISDGAARLFVRLLDLSLNPFLNNGRKGEIIVSQMKLGSFLNCDERSIRRRTDELLRGNYVWTTLVGRQNTKPIRCYHVTAFQPKRQAEQEMAGEGLWGNGKRRFDSGFARTGHEATGHQRRMGSLLVDRFGKQIFFNLPENTPARGQQEPLSPDTSVRCDRTLASSARGRKCPVTEDASVLSQRSILTGDSGQNCPVTKDAGVRHKESSVGDSAPRRSQGSSPPPKDALEEWIMGLKKRFPRELEAIKSKLLEQRRSAVGIPARLLINKKLKAVDEAILGPSIEEEPAKPKPVRALIKPEALNQAELLQSARDAMTLGLKYVTPEQKAALQSAGEL